jgi:hypothetical protein
MNDGGGVTEDGIPETVRSAGTAVLIRGIRGQSCGNLMELSTKSNNILDFSIDIRTVSGYTCTPRILSAFSCGNEDYKKLNFPRKNTFTMDNSIRVLSGVIGSLNRSE